MVPVEGGTFLLGDKVNIAVSAFEIGKYQVTQNNGGVFFCRCTAGCFSNTYLQ